MQFITNLDAKIISLIEPIRTPLLTKIFTAITYLGEWSVALVLIFIISVFFAIKKRARYDLIIWFTVIGSLATAFILKYAVGRARPIGKMINETSYSFPSAHAVIAITFYGLVACFLFRNAKNTASKILIAVAAVALAILLGFSRLYLDVHYFSDVVGGYILGFIWLAIGIYVAKKLSY